MHGSPIRGFALRALLWLPLGLAAWFWFAAPLAWPPIRIGGALLTGCWPELFASFRQGADILDAGGRVTAHAGYLMHLTTNVVVVAQDGRSGGGVGVLQPVINPMVYGYALPLFFGLAMATPLGAWRRAGQVAVAFGLIWLAQPFGVVAEALKVLAFNSGSAGA